MQTNQRAGTPANHQDRAAQLPLPLSLGRVRQLALKLLHTISSGDGLHGRQRRPDQQIRPALSYAAVTVMGIAPPGVRWSAPTPAIQLAAELAVSQRHRPQRQLPALSHSLIALAIRTLVGSSASPEFLSENLLGLIGEARKPSTIIKHSAYFSKWVSCASQRSWSILPIEPLEFATFLLEAARDDETVSPTLSRCSAAAFFSTLAGTRNPMEHVLCNLIREAFKRRLGMASRKKLPLLRHHVEAIINRQLSQNHTLETLLACLHIALMYEGCLRWSDLAQILFGDIIISTEFMRIFIQSAKTDAYRQGQWVTVATSPSPTSAYSLLIKVLDALALLWGLSTHHMRRSMLESIPGATMSWSHSNYLPLAHIPVTFAVNTQSLLPNFGRKTPYSEFLYRLKEWAGVEGLRREDIGTHSLRRGIASDWALLGIPDRLRREHGRWRSDKIADGYIDESISVRLRLQAFKLAELTPPSAEEHNGLIAGQAGHDQMDWEEAHQEVGGDRDKRNRQRAPPRRSSRPHLPNRPFITSME